jgi:hypothetical protein
MEFFVELQAKSELFFTFFRYIFEQVDCFFSHAFVSKKEYDAKVGEE